MTKYKIEKNQDGQFFLLENNGKSFPLISYDTYPEHVEFWEKKLGQENLKLDTDFKFLENEEIEEDVFHMMAIPISSNF